MNRIESRVYCHSASRCRNWQRRANRPIGLSADYCRLWNRDEPDHDQRLLSGEHHRLLCTANRVCLIVHPPLYDSRLRDARHVFL